MLLNVGSTGIRLIVIIAGYSVALAVGLGAVWLSDATRHPSVDASSAGMSAFVDAALFVVAAGVTALVPTAVLVDSLRRMVVARRSRRTP